MPAPQPYRPDRPQLAPIQHQGLNLPRWASMTKGPATEFVGKIHTALYNLRDGKRTTELDKAATLRTLLLASEVLKLPPPVTPTTPPNAMQVLVNQPEAVLAEEVDVPPTPNEYAYVNLRRLLIDRFYMADDNLYDGFSADTHPALAHWLLVLLSAEKYKQEAYRITAALVAYIELKGWRRSRFGLLSLPTEPEWAEQIDEGLADVWRAVFKEQAGEAGELGFVPSFDHLKQLMEMIGESRPLLITAMIEAFRVYQEWAYGPKSNQLYGLMAETFTDMDPLFLLMPTMVLYLEQARTKRPLALRRELESKVNEIDKTLPERWRLEAESMRAPYVVEALRQAVGWPFLRDGLRNKALDVIKVLALSTKARDAFVHDWFTAYRHRAAFTAQAGDVER